MNIADLYHIFLSHPIVTTDSRNCPSDSIFFALKGEAFNGNTFAAKALEEGCAYAVIDESDYAVNGDKRFVLVDNCLETLQSLANYHRRQLGTRVIGITGTNGKTTTKELISAVLSQRHSVLFTQGNLNNHIGVPLTLLRLRKEHQLAVIEMGANHPGEIKALAGIAEPDYGIITNVGKAHLEGFGSFEGVIKTKGELYDYLRSKGGSVVFIHHENTHLKAISGGLNLVEYGKEESLYVSGKETGCSPFLTFEWKSGEKEEKYTVQSRLIGGYNLDNVLVAITIGQYFDVPAKEINCALEKYAPNNHRSQLKQTEKNNLIIDAYNANPTSMMAALENFKQMKVKHKMVILGEMKELGIGSTEEHRKITDFIKTCDFERVLLIGDQFAWICYDYEWYANVQKAIEELQKNTPEDKYILIKGSNSVGLIKTVEYL